MTTLINTLRREDGNKARGIIFYQGPSEIDGSPIVAVALFGSRNTKTGNMVQTYIMRADQDPVEAVKAGTDSAVCGDCTHRGQHDETGALIPGTRTCYVVLGQGPKGVWKGLQAGQYPTVNAAGLFAGRFVRLGTYGDPAAVPFEVWEGLLEGTTGHNGYTHQWRDCDERFATLCMASADSHSDRVVANLLGYRTFRVRPDTKKLKGEFVCPASQEAGAKLQCAACKACGGTSSKAKADVTITIHGGSAVMANAKRRDMITV